MEADDPLWGAFVTVLASDGRVVGGGVYAHCGDPDRATLLSCAHVINLALGRDEFTAQPPGPAEVTLSFPAVPAAQVTARVSRWWPATGLTEPSGPPVPGRDGRWAGDLAELQSAAPLPAELRPVPLTAPDFGDELWAWRGNADPRTVVRLRANGAAGEWLVLEAPPTGFAVQPGYSGTPLWDRQRAAVVGLMVSAHERVPYSSMTTAVPIRQSYGIRGDVLRERLLGTLDPRGRLDADIRTLLKAQRQAAGSFPYRSVGHHRDDLTQVYVRQQLAAEDPPQGRSHSMQEAAQAEDERPPHTVEDFLARFRHVLIVGPPGTGKSTLTQQLAAQLVRISGRRGSGATQLVPIRVSARDLAGRPEEELSAAVSAAARAAISSRLHVDIGANLCAAPAGALEWLIIIDGLDEVENASARAELSDRLRRFMDVPSKHRLLLTTRPLAAREHARWEAQDDLGRCEIEPFERGQRRDFVHRWFRDQPDRAEDFLRQITAARLEEVVSVPLLATVAAIVFDERAGQPLPQTAFALYQRFVSHLYESRLEQLTVDLRARLSGWAEADQVMQHLVTGRIDLLEHCAQAWLNGAQILPAALEWLRAAGSQPYPQPTDWPDVVAAVLTSTGLVAHDGTALTFVHRSFAEHLAAAGAARRLPARFDADDPTWWHTLRAALTGGRRQDHETVLHRALLSDTGELLDWLLTGDDQARELAARLIFEGVPSTAAHHEALAETLSYWCARARAAGPGQLLRVLDAIRIAPAAVVEVLVDLLDAARYPLDLRDAAIRALLRADAATGEAVRALVAIVDERALAGMQRLRAAEMLMDLGAEARSAARAGLARISREHDWVLSDVRSRAAKLVEEIDTATPSHIAPDDPRRSRSMGVSSLGPWAHSTLVPQANRELWSIDVPFGNDPALEYEPRILQDLDLLQDYGITSPQAVSAGPLDGNADPRGHVLYPQVRAALGLPPTGPLDPAVTAEAIYTALWEVFAQPGLHATDPAGDLENQPSRDEPPQDSTQQRGPSGLNVTDQQWDAVARWLCAHPESHIAVMADGFVQVDEVINAATHGRIHALAAALIHGSPGVSRIAYDLLAHRILSRASAAVAPLQLLRIAAEGTKRAVDPVIAEPVIDAICLTLRDPQLRLATAYAQTARAMGSDLFATHLLAARSAEPRGTVQALLALDTANVPTAIRFLASTVRNPLDVAQWCAAVRLLRRLPHTVSPVTRLVREVIEATHDPQDVLELCRLLIHYTAFDTATEYLLDLGRDASVAPEHRRTAVELLPRGEGRERAADQAHAIIQELTILASPAERVTLAETLRTLDPRGCRSATTLLLTTLDDVTLPAAIRHEALALLVALGPNVRRRLVHDLEHLHAGPADTDAQRLTTLRRVSEWGPDLHRAAQSIWERQTQRRAGIDRAAMAAELYAWGWISAPRSSRLLTRIARSAAEEPQVRVTAAHFLMRHSNFMAHPSGEVLHELVRESRIAPGLALQATRELAAAGGLDEARRVLRHLIRDESVADNYRYKAATSLLMVDLTASPETLAALRHMTSDRSLTEHTRDWATFAVGCVQNGIHDLHGVLPASWLRS
ncbi:NACHT domain-containing protein [Streptomyces sp. NBC_01363]|uniref:NACHT domain-containing protein n=1 Tax=Streptomyces sp. NBC_01363 TaxID=2903840 RepID=UPI0022587F9F|nr:NACHT domain-containing protein [Streptomyces sp. NBC_01363]MCX4735085.1 NACHT domain-containing protein [Streptomyces sp. NBC_01363]